MSALRITQYVLAAMALAAMVAAKALSWELGESLWGLLGAVVGLALKRPSDALGPPEGL